MAWASCSTLPDSQKACGTLILSKCDRAKISLTAHSLNGQCCLIYVCLYVYVDCARIFRPGQFNYFLSSHQIWHVCVFAAVYVWYQNVMISKKIVDSVI